MPVRKARRPARRNRAAHSREQAVVAERESMEYDVVIVGAGPAGLAAAIRLKQLCAERGAEVSVCVLEKGSEVGAHILSGAVLEPRALDELLPDWKDAGRAAQHAGDGRGSLPVPHRDPRLPPADAAADAQRRQLHRQPRQRCAAGWAQQAEALGVEIYPGFAAAEVLYDEDGRVRAWPPATWASAKERRAGTELPARHGAAREADPVRRRLPRLADQDRSRALPPARGRRAADLRPRASRSCGRVEPAQHQARSDLTPSAGRSTPHLWRLVLYTWRTTWSRSASWSASTTRTPTSRRSRRCSASRPTRRSAPPSRVAGASPTVPAPSRRAGSSRSRSSSFPGGLLIGDTAGFLNVPKIKGTHTAMKSGMIAAEAAVRRPAGGRRRPRSWPIPSGCATPGSGTSCTRSATSGRPSAGGCRPAIAYSRRRHLPAARQGALDPASHRRPYALKPAVRLHADRLSQAGRQAHLRPAVLGVPLQHQPRGGPAGHLTLKDASRADRREPGALRRARAALLPGRRLRDRARRERRQSAPADQRAELRALQDLRHQGSRRRTSTGSCPKAAAVRTIPTCDFSDASSLCTINRTTRCACTGCASPSSSPRCCASAPLALPTTPAKARPGRTRAPTSSPTPT